jgi:hypothetical protein
VADAGFPPGLTSEELENAWERHNHHSGKEPMDFVFRRIMTMNGKFSLDKLRSNHGDYCEYWARTGWNKYGVLTFLGWIEAGMPPAPDKASSAPPKPTKCCAECQQKPCVCFDRQLERERKANAV